MKTICSVLCRRAGVGAGPLLLLLLLLEPPPVLPRALPQQEHLEEHVRARLHLVSQPGRPHRRFAVALETPCPLTLSPPVLQVHLSRHQPLLQLLPRRRQRHGPQLLLDLPAVSVRGGRSLAVALGDRGQVRPPWHPAPLHDDDGAGLFDPPGADGV